MKKNFQIQIPKILNRNSIFQNIEGKNLGKVHIENLVPSL